MFSRAMRILALLFVAGAAALPGGGPAKADDTADHERARTALEAGELMPLRGIIDIVERDHPGRILEVELEREDGRWLYEIKLLRDDGRMLKLKLDGRDGRVLSRRGRDASHRGAERRGD